MVKYVAHRGQSMNAPENTLPAFELAGKSGFLGIECDTYCTTDGRWIIHHDRKVGRMTDGAGQTKGFLFAEIRELNITSGNNLNSFPALKIPALEELLPICKKYGMHAFIEIEEYHKLADLQALVKLVEDSGTMAHCKFICFNAENLRLFERSAKRCRSGI